MKPFASLHYRTKALKHYPTNFTANLSTEKGIPIQYPKPQANTANKILATTDTIRTATTTTTTITTNRPQTMVVADKTTKAMAIFLQAFYA